MAETVIGGTLLSALIAEAKAAPDREVCGLLFGALDRIDAALAVANVAANPADSFEIDPSALLAAHKAARAGGPVVIGHYHSHPSGSAIPSGRDLAAAEPGRLWLILAGDDARLWFSREEGFTARSLKIAR